MDTITGSSSPDLLLDTQSGGNTIFYGLQGDDTLGGLDGNDTLYGGDGADTLLGGEGHDEIWGDFYHIDGFSPGNDLLFGDIGNDTLYGGAGGDMLTGGDGNDYILGDFFIDGGSAGNDTLDGGAGADTLQGEGGDDLYIITDLNDQIFDSSGNDTAYVYVDDFKVPDGIENVFYAEGVKALPYHIDAIYSGDRWGLFGEPVTLTYGFLVEPTFGATANGSSEFFLMGNSEKDAVRQAIVSWAAVSGITFVEDTNPITVEIANTVDLRFGLNSQPFSAGYAFYPDAGEIYIDIDSGTDLSTITHEIGHALGLKHPFEDGATLPIYEDSDQYSLMSYTTRADNFFREVTDIGGGEFDIQFYSVIPDAPQLYDIATIQYLYGANNATNSGNTLYIWLPDDDPFFEVIWDGGGTDTVDISAFTVSGIINLQEGRFSSVPIQSDALPPGFSGGTEPTYYGSNNLATAFGTVLENANGGSGADLISGNAANNVLNGGGGADIIAGGAGNDTYIVDNSGDLVMELGNSGIDLIQSGVAYSLMQAWHVENLTLTGGGAINGSGNWLGNALNGNGAANVLDGDRGNDTLTGGGGSDTLMGGAGDDVLVWDAADGRVDGGEGFDRLLVSGGGTTLDLTAISNALITDVEYIDITGSGNNTLTLALADVLALTPNTLRIFGDAGDVVNGGSGWTPGGTVSLSEGVFNVYTQSTAVLLVDSDVTRVFG